jgi:outer membrane protein
MRIFTYLLFGLLLLQTFASTGKAEAEPVAGVKLTLAKAVQLALANNIGLQLQKDDVSSAEGAREAAEGEFDIIAKGEGGAEDLQKTPLIPGDSEEERTAQWALGLQKKYTTGTEVSLNWKNSRFASTPATTFVDPVYNSGLSLGVRQPLLQGFGTERQTAMMRASDKNLAAATFMVSAEAASLAAKVKGAYWNLVYAWQDKSVKELSLTLARKLLDETEEKIRVGMLASVEIYQPQSEIARREESLISADRAIGLHEDELKLLLNSGDWHIPFIPTDLPPAAKVVPDLQAVEENALGSRPDLKAAELAAQAAKIQEEVALDNTRPSLAMVGLVGQGGTDDGYGDSLTDAVDNPKTQWQAGLAFSMPLQNSGAQGLYRQAGAAHNKAKNSVQLLRLQVQQSVRTTVRDVQLALKAMEATKKTTLATSKRLEAEQAKFDVGRATTFDVLTAQEAYAQALSQEKQGEVGYALALAELDRIQGVVSTGADIR